MSLIIIHNSILPFGHYKAMFFFGILFTKSDLSEVDINHERIHSAQCLELLGVGLYLWYAIEWLIKLLVYHNSHRAYRNISFEREAYSNEDDLNYTQIRKSFNFLKFLKS